MIPVWWQCRRALYHSAFAEFHRERNECTYYVKYSMLCFKVISSVVFLYIERHLVVPKLRFNKMERGLYYHFGSWILNIQLCNQETHALHEIYFQKIIPLKISPRELYESA